tara:strand:- start:739 stop:1485 length:747 start_codon:yes stop_codon:yes gene_type:complete
MRYFIGNWKMFGLPKSVRIINKINTFVKRDSNKKKYSAIIAPPFTLLESFSKSFKNKNIKIGAQNCYHKDLFSSNTGAISPYMIKSLSTKYVIVGHSDNRSEGDTDQILKKKVFFALKNNLKIIFCIGENKTQKKKNQTKRTLKKQITNVLEKKFNKQNIIVAYEPIWSIGTGKIPSTLELSDTTKFIKKVLNKIYKNKNTLPVLYGGSVDSSNIVQFKKLPEIDGFLIGGASKSSKNFIDIIKNYYK